MKRWSLAAAEFCLADPPLSIQTSPGDSFTVYVTEGVWGSQHQAALALATTSYTTSPINKKSLLVTVNDSVPTDSSGTFATMMIVSSQSFGHGVVYGSSTGTSGSAMSVSFGINPQKVTG